MKTSYQLLALSLVAPLLFACSDERELPAKERSIMKTPQIQALKEAEAVSKDVEESLKLQDDRMKNLRNQ
ncbi:MAG: hypothetical protein ABW116_17225 [Candidatus Sedimenticola sp. 20ELBAFRAG]